MTLVLTWYYGLELAKRDGWCFVLEDMVPMCLKRSGIYSGFGSILNCWSKCWCIFIGCSVWRLMVCVAGLPELVVSLYGGRVGSKLLPRCGERPDNGQAQCNINETSCFISYFFYHISRKGHGNGVWRQQHLQHYPLFTCGVVQRKSIWSWCDGLLLYKEKWKSQVSHNCVTG